MDYREYARAFEQVEEDFERAVEQFGLPFEPAETEPRERRAACAAACGVHLENGASSLWRTYLSPACRACRTGEGTATFFVDLRCTRNCYFCFNPNQQDYGFFREHQRDIARELAEAHRAGARFTCLAVTGGEPLLHKDAVYAFLDVAAALYPGAHVRLYTSGDLLDAACIETLAAKGLDEIRFSVKPEDMLDDGAGVYAAIAACVGTLPTVMVEVPVIPGGERALQHLLVRADELGVRGVNLLEFCFPLCNAREFGRRGFKLRKHPYRYLYDYWYGGGVPVAGSEAAALALLEFAARGQLGVGVHYCSSDNKNSGQLFQQNKPFNEDPSLRARYPWLTFDGDDYCLKCARVFGAGTAAVVGWARRAGVCCHVDVASGSVAVPLSQAAAVRAALGAGVEVAESVSVLEEEEGQPPYVRELAVRPLG